MEPKKNPKADLSKNSGLYFVIGLAIVMLIVWGAFEWKTYDKVDEYDISLNVEDQLDEEVPMTEQIKTPPPPPPPAAPEVIEVVEDEEEVEGVEGKLRTSFLLVLGLDVGESTDHRPRRADPKTPPWPIFQGTRGENGRLTQFGWCSRRLFLRNRSCCEHQQ